MKRVDIITNIKAVIFDNLLRRINAVKHQQLEIDIINSVVTKEDDIIYDFSSTDKNKVAGANTVNLLNDIKTTRQLLVVISNTQPPANEYSFGEKYYNLNNKKIYEINENGWANPLTPKSGDIYVFENKSYMWNGTDIFEVGVGIDSPSFIIDSKLATSQFPPQIDMINKHVYHTLVAPADFDPNAQPVNIIDIFNKYANVDKKYIYSVHDDSIALRLEGGTDYVVGFEQDGSKQEMTMQNYPIVNTGTFASGMSTELPIVGDISAYPASGIVNYFGNHFFTYSSKGTNKFIGASQELFSDTASHPVIYCFDFAGKSNGYIIVNNNVDCAINMGNNFQPLWVYLGYGCTSINVGRYICRVKYIHYEDANISFDRELSGRSLTNSIVYEDFWNNNLTGVFTTPKNITHIWYGRENDPFGNEIVGTAITELNITENVVRIDPWSIGLANCIRYNFYPLACPFIFGNGNPLGDSTHGFPSAIAPLHVRAGATGYDAWSAYFSEIVYDLPEPAYLTPKDGRKLTIDEIEYLGESLADLQGQVDTKVDKVAGSSLVSDIEIAKIHTAHSDDETTSTILNKIGDGSIINTDYLPAAVYSDFLKVKYWQDTLPTSGMIDADICYEPTAKILNCYVAGIGWVEIDKRTDTMYIVINVALSNHLYKYIWDTDMINLMSTEGTSQAEAEAGTSSKFMSALRTVQSITYQLINLDFSSLTTTSKKVIGAINELKTSLTNKLETSLRAAANGVGSLNESAVQPVSECAVGKTISDTTYEAVWNTYSLSVNTSTGVFTAGAAHGFTNGQLIEFCANGGTLPTGISAYDADILGGYYYSIINVSGLTFQICATVGGATVLIPSTTGSGSYQCRGALTSVAVALPVLANYNNQVTMYLSVVRGTTSTGNALIVCRINNDATAGKYVSTDMTLTGLYLTGSSTTNKYIFSDLRIDLRRTSARELNIYSSALGFQTNDKSTYTALTNSSAYARVINLASEAATLNVLQGTGNVQIRSVRAIIVQK